MTDVNNVLNFNTDTEDIARCREALMKMYNASGIEEDLQSDMEVARVNSVAKKESKGKRDTNSPTSVTEGVMITGAPPSSSLQSQDDDEDDELDSEVAGINAGYMNRNNSRPPSRSASRCSNGRVSANSWVGVTSDSGGLSSSSGDVKVSTFLARCASRLASSARS